MTTRALTLCAPGDHQEPLFILRFDDPDQREMLFADEAEARAIWEALCGPGGTWNGYLFGLLSNVPDNSHEEK